MPKKVMYKASKPYLGCDISLDEAASTLFTKYGPAVTTSIQAWKAARKTYGKNDISISRLLVTLRKMKKACEVAGTDDEDLDGKDSDPGYEASPEDQVSDEDDTVSSKSNPVATSSSSGEHTDIALVVFDENLDIVTIDIKNSGDATESSCSRRKKRKAERPVYMLEDEEDTDIDAEEDMLEEHMNANKQRCLMMYRQKYREAMTKSDRF
jgi:hypothetical protein